MHRGDQVTYYKALLKKHIAHIGIDNQVAEALLNQCFMDNYSNYRFLVISEQEKFEAEAEMYNGSNFSTIPIQIRILLKKKKLIRIPIRFPFKKFVSIPIRN
jgi:hypothetical protein